MKVIAQGKNLAPTKIITCDRCGCVFEYDSLDVRHIPEDKIFGEYYMKNLSLNYVICPNSSCSKIHIVDKI